MAAFGFVTMLVASILPMLCPVVGAPVNPNDLTHALARPLDSISSAFHSNYPAEHEAESSDPFAGHRSGWQVPSNPTTREHAAIHPDWRGGTSHYSADVMTLHPNNQPWYPTVQHSDPWQYQSLEPWQQHLTSPGERSSSAAGYQPNTVWMPTVDDGASSSRGGAGLSGQHPQPGLQQPPSALIYSGSASYDAVESRLQHQHPSAGGGPFDLEDLLDYTPDQIDEMAMYMNSPDPSTSPPSSLAQPQAVQPYPRRNAAVGGKQRKRKSQRGTVRHPADGSASKEARRQAMLKNAIRETDLDLLKYAGSTRDDGSILNLASTLKELTDEDLLGHAQVAFDTRKTFVQDALQSRTPGDTGPAPGFVQSTDHQVAIIQELFVRRLNKFGYAGDQARGIHVTPDPTFLVDSTNINHRFDRIIAKESTATLGPFEEPNYHSGVWDKEPHLKPFVLGEYGIYVFESRRGRFEHGRVPRDVFAYPLAVFERLKESAGQGRRKRPTNETKSIFLGRTFYEA